MPLDGSATWLQLDLFQPATSMTAPSATSSPTTCAATPNVISLQELEDGLPLSGLRGGLTIVPSGPAALPASRTPEPTPTGAASMTSATFGPSLPGCSEAAARLSSWESSLRMRLPMAGGTKLPLTWKERATPAGRSASLLVRSGRNTKGSDFGLLPTLAARDYRFPNAKPYSERGGGKKGQQLPEVMGGPLNPAWCLSFMGFPEGWEASRPQATPSSRRSRPK